MPASDLISCAAEPIRIPGAIQPHGALLVVDPETLAVLHVSANFAQVTGLQAAVGDGLEKVEGADGIVAELRRWLSGDDDAALLRVVTAGDRRLQLQAHRTGQGMILEFEQPPVSETSTLEGLYSRLRAFLAAISTASDIDMAFQAAVREVRALTGFNRVLLYSFDEKGDGTVLAEDGDGVLPSYLGLRFPASDIPQQARALYTLNRIRLIADADYGPCPVEPALSPVDGEPLDLSHAALRSVSPIHLEYMRNMGTGSSMSISIVVNGVLWGLISAHGREPMRVNAPLRTACDMLGRVLSLHVESRQQALHNAQRLQLRNCETLLLAQVAGASSFQQGLADNAETWMALTGAEGAAVVTPGSVLSVGLTPSEAEIAALAAWLHDSGQAIVATDSLSEVWPDAPAFAEAASGVLAISISQIHPDFIIWFRPEVIRTVKWGGDPTKAVERESGRLHPRKSFELWREQVRAHSRPWSAAEVESAEMFRSSIQNFVLRRAEERAELTGRLERINKELEAFSYSVSHDLRAPFRHIVGYAELLSDRERTLDATSMHYLRTIKEAAIGAGRLVDDLLNFSQLGRTHLTMTAVDMRKLVDEVRRSLSHSTADRRIDWRIGDLPPAWGDVAMVRQVLQNLVQNAIKYTSTREMAEISISGRDLGPSIAYTVSDNGVGFEMQYVGKLFGVFQRLHRAEEFEGTGIGLALVKRIVDRHGGTVEARGTPGQGAFFTFTLPKRDTPKGESAGG